MSNRFDGRRTGRASMTAATETAPEPGRSARFWSELFRREHERRGAVTLRSAELDSLAVLLDRLSKYEKGQLP